MLAEFLGTLLGTALKAAGPEFFVAFVKALNRETAVIGKPNEDAQKDGADILAAPEFKQP